MSIEKKVNDLVYGTTYYEVSIAYHKICISLLETKQKHSDEYEYWKNTVELHIYQIKNNRLHDEIRSDVFDLTIKLLGIYGIKKD